MDARLSLFTLLTAAVLVFWAVGAYNRLVGLRSELLRAIAAVDAQFHARQAVRVFLALVEGRWVVAR